MISFPVRLIRPLALAGPLVFAAPVHAQQVDEQLWFQANTNVPLARNVRVTLEQIARFSDRQDGLFTTEFGGLLGFRVAKGIELGFGYRRVDPHNSNVNTTFGENRLRQQVVATVGPLTMRFRVDERFSAGGPQTGFRIRPLVRYNQRLGPPGLALFASHESFFLPNSTDWGQRRGYERMRNIVGVMVPLGRDVSADLGYLNQYRFARNGARAQMDHALTVQLTFNLTDHPAAPTHD